MKLFLTDIVVVSVAFVSLAANLAAGFSECPNLERGYLEECERIQGLPDSEKLAASDKLLDALLSMTIAVTTGYPGSAATGSDLWLVRHTYGFLSAEQNRLIRLSNNSLQLKAELKATIERRIETVLALYPLSHPVQREESFAIVGFLSHAMLLYPETVRMRTKAKVDSFHASAENVRVPLLAVLSELGSDLSKYKLTPEDKNLLRQHITQVRSIRKHFKQVKPWSNGSNGSNLDH